MKVKLDISPCRSECGSTKATISLLAALSYSRTRRSVTTRSETFVEMVPSAVGIASCDGPPHR